MGASGLGSLLVKEGFLTEQDRLTITKTCGQGSWAFAKSILAIGLLDEDELAAFFAERTRYQIAPKDFLNHLDQSAIQAIDRRLVSKLEVIPLKKDHGKITVGVVDPLDRSTLKQLEFFTGFDVDPVVIPLSQLYEGLVRIDPEFRYQATALTHFLQNHAQSAWVRQKLESDDGIAAIPSSSSGSERVRSSANDIEEIYDDLPEIEEVEDNVAIEEDTEGSDSEFEIETEVEENADTIDPFAGAALDSEEHNDDLGAEVPSRSKKIDTDDLLELDDGSELDDVKTEPMDEPSFSATEELNFDSHEDDSLSSDLPQEQEEMNLDEQIETSAASHDNKETGGFEGLSTLDDDDAFDNEPTVTKAQSSLNDDSPISAQADRDDFEMDEIKADSEPMSSFGFEETKPRAMPSVRNDILDTMDDLEPSLDVSKLPSDGLDRDLLADLHSEIEADDHSPNVDPEAKASFGFDDEPSVIRAPTAQAKSSFQDEEETHIDLRPSPSHRSDDDDDILLHPEKAKLNPQSDFGLNPTSALNEMMVKLSLSWSSEGSLKVLRDNLFKIGEAGALFNTKSQQQILWANGSLISLELGPAALLPMVKGASLNKWQSLELKAAESWTQKGIKLKIYREGDWLWAHHLKSSDDTEIFRDTVESALSQLAHKLA